MSRQLRIISTPYQCPRHHDAIVTIWAEQSICTRHESEADFHPDHLMWKQCSHELECGIAKMAGREKIYPKLTSECPSWQRLQGEVDFKNLQS
jgi:hypothetical protein